MNNVKVVLMDEVKWDKFKSLMISKGYNEIKYEEISMSCIIPKKKSDDKKFLIIRKKIWKDLDEDEKEIIICHEKAHLDGIRDEELADIYALEFLNITQQKMLQDMWEERHGYKYSLSQ